MKLKLLFVSILLLNGCMKVVTVQHPGAINSFDNLAYDTLLTEQAAINQAKTEIAQFPAAKVQLNNVITQYDTTMLAYKAYHIAALAGMPPDTQALQGAIDALVTNLASLIKSMIPTPPAIPAVK